MTGQFNRVDVTVLPVGWTNLDTGSLASEVSGSWSPALSPDGRHAAYVSDRSGTPEVWVQPVGSDLRFLVDTGVHPVMGVQWSTGGGWLACQIAPGGAPRHEIWLVRPDGSGLHRIIHPSQAPGIEIRPSEVGYLKVRTEDTSALDRLLDPDADEGVLRREDLFLLSAYTVHTAQPKRPVM